MMGNKTKYIRGDGRGENCLLKDKKATETAHHVWTAVRKTNVKQTETLKELIYIPEEGVYMNVCDLGVSVCSL